MNSGLRLAPNAVTPSTKSPVREACFWPSRSLVSAASRFESAAAQALRDVRIPESLWSSFPSVLSGGERQRVNIAKGTIAAPRLLLLDEPVSALDPENRDAVLERIAGLRESNVALLSVFHDLDAMRRLATRVVMLREGLVTDNGAPNDVLALQ